eukprot:gnl/Dysnectes_brevis/3157_a3938_456.p1 GENE.gnl/Dysnectes_brevis/3157_a3938_456~~gnl/Dysnectes_brevis/3157_a3938_456.p1  ORF type:complete len:317 (-),score=47.07 gnl/Dysnectes_brevis/3157_a3938_456:36-986(-)
MSNGQRGDSDCYTRCFVGGLNWKTSSRDLKTYFTSKCPLTRDVSDPVINAEVIMNKTGKKQSRGFGFVTFRTHQLAAKCTAEKHFTIDGRICECKAAFPENYSPSYPPSFVNCMGRGAMFPDQPTEYYAQPTMVTPVSPALATPPSEGRSSHPAQTHKDPSKWVPQFSCAPFSPTPARIFLAGLKPHHSAADIVSLCAQYGSGAHVQLVSTGDRARFAFVELDPGAASRFVSDSPKLTGLQAQHMGAPVAGSSPLVQSRQGFGGYWGAFGSQPRMIPVPPVFPSPTPLSGAKGIQSGPSAQRGESREASVLEVESM